MEATAPAFKPHWLWNSQTASEMAKLAAEKRRGGKWLDRQEFTLLQNAAMNGQSSKQSKAHAMDDAQTTEELNNAREQLALVSKRLTNALQDPETLPVDIERLVRSVAALREDVRELSGKPRVGTLKPVATRQKVSQADLPPPE